MKKTILPVLAFAGILVAGCEKNTGCEKYSPWPTSSAVAAWTEYSADLLDCLDAYNSVSKVLNYLGKEPDSCHDSIIVRMDRDSVLICGYLKLWNDNGYCKDYYLIDHLSSRPIAVNRDDFVTVSIWPHDEIIDTLKKVYIPATLLAINRAQGAEAWGRKYDHCADYGYTFFAVTNNEAIRYEE